MRLGILVFGFCIWVTPGFCTPARQDPVSAARELVFDGLGPVVPAIPATWKGDEAIAAELRNILHDDSKMMYWPRAVRLLGAVSTFSPRAAHPLFKFVQTGCSFEVKADCPSGIDPLVFDAKLKALLALGALLGNSSLTSPTAPKKPLEELGQYGTQRILTYLVSGADPAYWKTQIPWSVNGVAGESRDLQLALHSIRALALSGLPELAGALMDALDTLSESKK